MLFDKRSQEAVTEGFSEIRQPFLKYATDVLMLLAPIISSRANRGVVLKDLSITILVLFSPLPFYFDLSQLEELKQLYAATNKTFDNVNPSLIFFVLAGIFLG